VKLVVKVIDHHMVGAIPAEYIPQNP